MSTTRLPVQTIRPEPPRHSTTSSPAASRSTGTGPAAVSIGVLARKHASAAVNPVPDSSTTVPPLAEGPPLCVVSKRLPGASDNRPAHGYQHQTGRGYAPKGKTPVARRTATKLTTPMISAANRRGLMRSMCFKRALNAALSIAFLRRLIRGAPGKAFLIIDNLRMHHSKKVSQRVEAHSVEITRLFPPAYAPEHNPDEYLNNDLKQKLKNPPRPDTHEELIRIRRRYFAHSSGVSKASGPVSATAPAEPAPVTI